MNDDELEKILVGRWDAVVIGTGMGGAAAGYALARAGKRVLFLEMGRWLLPDSTEALRGDFAESFASDERLNSPAYLDKLSRAGRYRDCIEDWSGARLRRYIPYIGSGTGGSTGLYGAGLTRFPRTDFSPGTHYAGIAGADVPAHWPVSYEEMRPHYVAAEALFGVHGSPDPSDSEKDISLLPPARPGPIEQEFFSFLQGKGLHPFQPPLGMGNAANCVNCLGYLCPKPCKRDAATVFVLPALENFGARLVTDCRAIRLEATKTHVTGVICRYRGRLITFNAEHVFLAAGALESPCLLLRSKSALWPQGLANTSGLVGRYLMRHFIDLYLIKPKSKAKAEPLVTIAFNDLYNDPKFGVGGACWSYVSFPSPAATAREAEGFLAFGAWKFMLPFYRAAQPLVEYLVKRFFSNPFFFCTIAEDLPSRDNRVWPNEAEVGVKLVYRMHDFDRRRVHQLRKKTREVLSPYASRLLGQAENNKHLAHACGTCRMGDDPLQSVVNADNRAHDVANLYVVDASWFPTSTGCHLSLTIAANALRAADRFLQRLEPKSNTDPTRQ